MFLKIQVQMNISWSKRAFTHFLVYKWLTHTFYMCASLRALVHGFSASVHRTVSSSTATHGKQESHVHK